MKLYTLSGSLHVEKLRSKYGTRFITVTQKKWFPDVYVPLEVVIDWDLQLRTNEGQIFENWTVCFQHYRKKKHQR